MTDHKASQSLRSWCKVTWNNGNTNDYKVGHEGKLDLVMIEGASGGSYYPEHLAPLGHYSSLPPDGKHVWLMCIMYTVFSNDNDEEMCRGMIVCSKHDRCL